MDGRREGDDDDDDDGDGGGDGGGGGARRRSYEDGKDGKCDERDGGSRRGTGGSSSSGSSSASVRASARARRRDRDDRARASYLRLARVRAGECRKVEAAFTGVWQGRSVDRQVGRARRRAEKRGAERRREPTMFVVYLYLCFTYCIYSRMLDGRVDAIFKYRRNTNTNPKHCMLYSYYSYPVHRRT